MHFYSIYEYISTKHINSFFKETTKAMNKTYFSRFKRDYKCNSGNYRNIYIVQEESQLIYYFPLIFVGLYTRVWDVADYVIPPAENGAFFVATNVIITANQTRG